MAGLYSCARRPIPKLGFARAGDRGFCTIATVPIRMDDDPVPGLGLGALLPLSEDHDPVDEDDLLVVRIRVPG